jgi:hypothetical protein
MADEVSTPAAESSTAPEAKPPADDIGSMAVPTDPEAYAEWRQTGQLPENGRKPPKKEDSATSKKTSVDSEESESATVSETASPAGKRSAQKRIDQLTAEREAFRKELEEYKAKAGKQDAKIPESSSVPPAPDPSQRPARPKQEDFKTWDAYEAASDKYLEDLADWKANQKLEEHSEKLRQQAATEVMQTRLNEAKSRYGEEAEPKVLNTATTVFEDKQVPPAIKAAIGRSEVLVDALYVMGSDAEELASFVDLAKKDPLEALRKWFTVEALVKQELSKSPEPEASPEAAKRAADGKFVPAKKSAPAPPTELNGNSSPPGDERDRAANTGNVRAFFTEGNRRDAQRWKGNY